MSGLGRLGPDPLAPIYVVSPDEVPRCGAEMSHLCCVLACLLSCFHHVHDPMDCRPLGSSVHGDSPARILNRIATPSSRGSSLLTSVRTVDSWLLQAEWCPLKFMCSRSKSQNLRMWLYLETGLLKRFSSVQLLSRVRLFVTPRTAARQASESITNSQSLLKLMSIESVVPKGN